MAIPKHKSRFLVTLDNELHEILNAEAQSLNVAKAQLATFIIENHFALTGKYTPEQTQWRINLKKAMNNQPDQA